MSVPTEQEAYERGFQAGALMVIVPLMCIAVGLLIGWVIWS